MTKYDDMIADLEVITPPTIVQRSMLQPEDVPKAKRCEKEYKRFLEARGKIITEAVKVERRMTALIVDYFFPSFGPDSKVSSEEREECERRWGTFHDLVVSDLRFVSKTKIVKGIMAKAEIRRTKHLGEGLCKAIRAIGETRNRYAHQRAGIEWSTAAMHLWCKNEAKWHVVDPDEPEQYSRKCSKAVVDLWEVDAAIRSIRCRDTSE